MTNSDSLIEEIKQEIVLRICNEGIPRIKKCLSHLDEEQVWFSPNEQIPSIANLILHLNGNVRQWFLDGFCAIVYIRYRENEFNAKKTLTKLELLNILDQLSTDIQNNIYKIKHDILLDRKVIQQHFEVSGYSIISHVIEHFSYHVGQITTLTKILTSKDLAYYGDMDL